MKEIFEKVAAMVDDNDGYYLPQIFEILITEEEGEFILLLPDSVENLAVRSGKSLEDTVALVKELTKKGILQYKDGAKKVYLAHWIVTLSDGTVQTPFYDEERGPRFFELFHKLRTDPEYLKVFYEEILEDGAGKPMYRVVPRYDAIKNIPGVMPCENLKEILKEHDGKISAARCMCRTIAQDPNCPVKEGPTPETGHCIRMDGCAEYSVEVLGIGDYVPADTMFEMLRKDGEEMPFYHMFSNAREVFGGFCNCCACCCDMRAGLSVGDLFKGLSPSRFLSVVDESLCKGCGKCEERCPFDAVKIDPEKHVAAVDAAKCMGCGVCVVGCKNEALELKIVRKPEHIPIGGKQYWLEGLEKLKPDYEEEN